MLLPGLSSSDAPGIGDLDARGLNTSKLSGSNATPDRRGSPKSSPEGGGRGDTDFRVGMVREGPLALRSLAGLGEWRGLGVNPGLVARGLTRGAGL